MASHEPMQTASDSEDAGGEPTATTGREQPLQSLQLAADSDSDDVATESDPPLRMLATASEFVSDGEGEPGHDQPLLLARESSQSDNDPCKLATASDSDDEDGLSDEGVSSGALSTKRARCSVPSLPAAICQKDVQSLWFLASSHSAGGCG